MEEKRRLKGVIKYSDNSVYDGEYVISRLGKVREGQGRFVNAQEKSVYVGGFVDNLRDGFGVFSQISSDGEIRYEGTWKDGKKHGRGLLVTVKFSYDGEFTEDHIEGSGVYVFQNGDRYVGSLRKGKFDGQGKLSKGQDVYEGGFLAGKFHGFGTYQYGKEQGSYSGEYKDGLPHGKGLRIFGSGNRFDGEFVKGEMYDGVYSTYQGDVYIGKMKNNRYHGMGVLTMAQGDTYRGNFLEGVFYGKGKYTYADGSYYEGEYLNVREHPIHKKKLPYPDGKRNGHGTRVWMNGNKYVGSWKDNRMEGFGTMHYKNGSIYEGNWCLGYPHGQGTMVYCKGERVYESPLKLYTGIGKIIRADYAVGNCKYVGHWKRGEWDGKGTYECGDGTVYQGEFRNGLRHGKGSQTLIPVSHLQNRVGVLYRAEKYVGHFQDGQFEGRGVLFYENGARKIKAEFKKSQIKHVIANTFDKNYVPSKINQKFNLLCESDISDDEDYDTRVE